MSFSFEEFLFVPEDLLFTFLLIIELTGLVKNNKLST